MEGWKVTKEEMDSVCQRAAIIRGKMDELLIGHTSDFESQESRYAYLTKSCTFYEFANTIFEGRLQCGSRLKVPYYFEMISVLEAMMAAFDLKPVDSLNAGEESGKFYDETWTKKLAEELKEHYRLTAQVNGAVL